MSDRLEAVVIAVGDELLYGATVDTNGSWIGSVLAQHGIPVLERRVVGDSLEAIRTAVLAGLESATLVVVTGGLGPTPDDCTREAVAGALGLDIHTDPELIAMLERRFRAFGHTSLPADNLSQASVPDGAVVLENPRGSAPGLFVTDPRNPTKRVALLPGVPREMRGIFEEQLMPRVSELYADRLSPVVHRWIYTTGIAESVLSERLSEVLPGDTNGVGLAFLPKLTGVHLRLTVRGESDRSRADAAIDVIERLIAPVVEPFRYEAASGDLVEALGNRLKDAGLRLAVAESCTGGLIAARITDQPGASAFFIGGVIAYANDVKVEKLGVSPEALTQYGAVSEVVAMGMAEGVRHHLGADASIAITGIAGPGGGSEEKPVGTVWYAASVGDRRKAVHRRFAGNREAIRTRSAQAALHLLYRMLE